MPPPKPRLHNKTGKLKNINKAYSSSSPAGPETSDTSTRRNNRVAENTATQSEAVTNTSTSATLPAPSPTASSSSDTTQQFEIELCWCIQTMEKSLESGNFSPKQVQEMEKTVRLLKSANQSTIKKRQIMHTAFGDYRAKMQEEEKRLSLGARSIQFIASSSAADGSKKSTSTAQNATACAPTKSYFVKKSLTSTLGEKSFQFDFPVSEIEKLKIDPVQPPPSEPEIDATATNSVTLHGPSITSKVIASDNSFKFNFSIN